MQSFTPWPHAAATETAFVTKPAPTFTADAVVNGEFRKVSLSDYKGTAPRLGPLERVYTNEALAALSGGWSATPSQASTSCSSSTRWTCTWREAETLTARS